MSSGCRDDGSELVGGTGIEPVTSSVSEKPERNAHGGGTWLHVAFTCDFVRWVSPGKAHRLPLLALSLALGWRHIAGHNLPSAWPYETGRL
jgi:hypothetical protein